MGVLRFAPPRDLALSAPPSELARLREAILGLGPGEDLFWATDPTAHPGAYVRCLRALRVEAGEGPTLLRVDGDVLVVRGALENLDRFASFLDVEPGGHSHYEAIEGLPWVDEASLPLVVEGQ